jgi:hypothetical protein
VKRILLLLLVVLSVMGLGVAVSYQLAARERHYRDLLARGNAALRDGQTFARFGAGASSRGTATRSMRRGRRLSDLANSSK